MFARAMFKPELLRARHPGPQHSLAALRAVGSNWRPRAASSCRLMLPTTPRKLDTHPVRPTLPSCCVAHYLVPSFELMTTNTANTVEAASHWHTPHHNIPSELIMSRRASPVTAPVWPRRTDQVMANRQLFRSCELRPHSFAREEQPGPVFQCVLSEATQRAAGALLLPLRYSIILKMFCYPKNILKDLLSSSRGSPIAWGSRTTPRSRPRWPT